VILGCLVELLRFCLWIFVSQLFEKVEVDKPAASRSESAEIYVLGLRYKAPAKIDPRLLDVKHLFQGSVEPQPKVINLFVFVRTGLGIFVFVPLWLGLVSLVI